MRKVTVKCDRCGRLLYEYDFRENEKQNKSESIFEDLRWFDMHGGHVPDLCGDCQREFYEWFYKKPFLKS